MSKCIGFTMKEAVRVQVVKYVGEISLENKKFSVDPQITTFEVLSNLLSRAFDIKGEFMISYLTRDIDGCSRYCHLMSDWDLDAAFQDLEPAVGDPVLQLRVELINKSSIENIDEKVEKVFSDRPSLRGTILNQMEKTILLMQKAFNIGDQGPIPVKNPLTDARFHNYLDGNGEVIAPKEFRKTVFHGGVEPALRKVVWKHLLNVYPCGLTAKERISYMKQKALEYHLLKSTWEAMVSSSADEELRHIMNMVRKDVRRTDRTHSFYAGADDNTNLTSLFNILITYALNHPSVSYCQGMSDLASPILLTMKDEAHAYVCFCALMQRMKNNFSTDGITMTLKFQHLQELLEYYDSDFFEFLRKQGAAELLFCYRWLLLELKREFVFDDALYMLEVMWSSLVPKPPQHGLPLWEVQFNPKTQHLHHRINPFNKVRTIRKHNSFSSIRNVSRAASEDSTSSTETESPQSNNNVQSNACDRPPRLQRASKSDDVTDCLEYYNESHSLNKSLIQEPLKEEDLSLCLEYTEFVDKRPSSEYKLPSPQELGNGSPFMIFLCLTILLQHRDAVMRTCIDANEIAMYFDKLVRKHNVHQVLHQARTLFKQYLQEEENADMWNDPKV